MKQFRLATRLAIVLLVAALLQTPAAAGGEGAEVYNRADGLYAFFNAKGGSYRGPAVLVQTPSGNVRGNAQAKLLDGTAVTDITYTTKKFKTRFGEIYAEIKLEPTGKAKVQFYNLPERRRRNGR
jgi:hypothetical protein